MPRLDASNQISYETYCQMGGCCNSSLVSILRYNGTQAYFTYHYVGHGGMFWKKDLKGGP